MFGLKKKTPNLPAFVHSDDCKILKADPSVRIEWSEIRRGHWEAVCECGREYYDEPIVEDRVRLDPLDPKTSRHARECVYRDTIDPAMIKLILNVKPGMSEGYDWVTCNACDCAWQVPHYAA